MPEVQELKVSWEQAVEQFDNLIKFAAVQQVQNRATDNMLSVDDFYQEGQIKLYQCWEKWCVQQDKGMDEFGPIFRKALFRRMRQCCERYAPTTDVDDVQHLLEDPAANEDIVERMHRDMSLSQLYNMLSGDVPKKLVSELIQPSATTLWHVWADIRRKEQLKSQGHKVNVPKDNTVRMKHIIRSLGITTKQYDNAMLEIRSKVREAFGLV